MKSNNLVIQYVSASGLYPSDYNPRKWDNDALEQLKTSFKKYGQVDPLIVNSAPNRRNVLIGGHFRLIIAQELGMKTVPVVYVHIEDIEREKELNLRLNRNTGEWDMKLLADFDESLLEDVGFSSTDIDEIFEVDPTPEVFDLKKELEKLNIKKIKMQKGDVWQLGPHRLKIGDSTIEADVLDLMNGEKADMCLTDPPYLLNYLKGKKKNGKPTEGFGYKRDRKYLETDEIPPTFTADWMRNVYAVAKEDFHIICYENWKNIPVIWSEMEKYWKIRNMIVWRVPNRVQGFSAKHKFFNKHDIAMVGSSGEREINNDPEEELLQNEYETALYAISGKPYWESYKKGKKYNPTDFIEYHAADAKSSGQSIIFGTKPLEILIPYLKILTKRNDLVIEPFGGSGSTLIASHIMKRRCYLMEKSPIYAEVIRNRWERISGMKAKKL